MPLLYYWRPDNYRRDRAFGFGFHLNQDAPAMLTAAPGDSLWAFTRRPSDGLYVLAAELIVKLVTHNPPNYLYGRYRVWGDLRHSRYFDIDLGPNAEPLIRHLQIRASSSRLGMAFQGRAAVRRITEADHQVLASFARDLPVLTAAVIYPEDQFEARLVHGELDRSRVLRESAPEYAQRLTYLFESVDVQRVRRNVETLQAMYQGRCQVCLFDPRVRYGHRLCHGHHIQWLSRGGEDDLANMVLLCPNHHAAVHRDDAPFNYRGHTFTFSNGLAETLQINEHLAVG